MLYELINVSDPYTFHADDPKIAQAVALLVGSTGMGLVDDQGNDYPTMLLVEKDIDAKLEEIFGLPMNDFVQGHYAELAVALDSVMSVGFRERNNYDAAIARMATEERESYRDEVHDRNRTSMSDYGWYAWRLARKCREKLEKGESNAISDTPDHPISGGGLV
ncbi:MAG TPA: hypothetical protein VMW24_20400 [Sedimentisphaerales bacterium]|nr:hypothetical protein [Sedimentisphaerales bacterium]